MNNRSSKSNPFLWWAAVSALVVSGALYYLLGSGAEADIHIRKLRIMLPLIGVVIAGICLICGTANRWFYPK